MSETRKRQEGNRFIYDEWYKQPEVIPDIGYWKLKCGVYDITVARGAQNLATHETQHHNLRQKYFSSIFVKEISHLEQELEILFSEIRPALVEFSDKSELPGSRRLCSRNI